MHKHTSADIKQWVPHVGASHKGLVVIRDLRGGGELDTGEVSFISFLPKKFPTLSSSLAATISGRKNKTTSIFGRPKKHNETGISGNILFGGK